jgi:hypothetical protein
MSLHGPDGFLDRRVRVGPVAEHQVDEIQSEALERAVDGLQQVLAVQRVAAVDGRSIAAVQSPVELAADDVVQARPFQLP